MPQFQCPVYKNLEAEQFFGNNLQFAGIDIQLIGLQSVRCFQIVSP